jgi:hypothetical protein
MTYVDAVNFGLSMQIDVNAGKMPPWPPDPAYSHFRDEKVLTAAEISAINSWVDGGMPEGDVNLQPTPPVYNGLSLMQQVDATIDVPHYTVSIAEDDFRSFVVHSELPVTKYINQMEVIPGDFSMVHHLFVYQDTSDESAIYDDLYPGPGFASFGSGVYSPYAELLGGWTPGSSLFTLPYNMGLKVPAGTDYVIAFHYAPNSLGKTDSTKINLKFAEVDSSSVREITVPRYLYWHPPSLTDGPLFIPANQVKTFHEQSEAFTEDLSLLALQPHCHLFGTSWKVFMVTAPGDTTNLIYIPHWDFDWQMCYFFTKIIKIPIGAKIFGTAVFDNTVNNPNNPSNPPEDVSAGEATTDEMMSCRFWVTDYQLGDEDILLDSSYYTGSSPFSSYALPLKVTPNPAQDKIYFMATLPAHEIEWQLSSLAGQVVKSGHESSIPNGMYVSEINISDLPSGSYYMKVRSGDEHAIAKVIVVH